MIKIHIQTELKLHICGGSRPWLCLGNLPVITGLNIIGPFQNVFYYLFFVYVFGMSLYITSSTNKADIVFNGGFDQFNSVDRVDVNKPIYGIAMRISHRN